MLIIMELADWSEDKFEWSEMLLDLIRIKLS